MRVPDPRGVERSRVSRRAHVARAYPASREGGPECCVYASSQILGLRVAVLVAWPVQITLLRGYIHRHTPRSRRRPSAR